MFKKILKYDMKAISRLWWIGAVVSLGAGIIGALLIRLFLYSINNESDNIFVSLLSVFAIIAAILCILAMTLSFVLTMVLVFTRFYKHFFTDEGYLTFTLPVSRSHLLMSKTVNAMIWFVLHMLVLILSLLLFAWLVIPPENDGFLSFIIFKEIGKIFASGWEALGGWFVVYVVEILLGYFGYMLLTISLVHFCISFASSLVKKAKVVVAIGLFYAFSYAGSFIVQSGVYFFGLFLADGMISFMENATNFETSVVMALLFLAIVGAIYAVGFTFYSITQFLLDRKLNLA